MNIEKMRIIAEDEAPSKRGSQSKNYHKLLIAAADLEQGQVIEVPECNNSDCTIIKNKLKEAYKTYNFDVYGRTVDGEYKVFVKLIKG